MRFLLKNVRELLDIQLFQAYTKSETLIYNSNNNSTATTTATTTATNTSTNTNDKRKKKNVNDSNSNSNVNDNNSNSNSNSNSNDGSNSYSNIDDVKRSTIDKKALYDHRAYLDKVLSHLKDYITNRILLGITIIIIIIILITKAITSSSL